MRKYLLTGILTIVTTLTALNAVAQDTTLEPNSEISPINAQIAEGIAAAPSDDNSYLRIAHFSHDAPTVDIYFNGTLAISGLNYLSASPWIPLAPATYSVAISPHEATLNDAVMPPFDVSASTGMWQTVAIVGSAANSTLKGVSIPEMYDELFPGTGGFTFFNALESAPTVNLMRDDILYYAEISYPVDNSSISSSSVRDDTGVFHVQIVDANDPTNAFADASELQIPENGYSLLALVGTLDDPQLVEIVTDESEVSMVRGLLPAPGTIHEALDADDNLKGFGNALAGSSLSDQLSDLDAEYTIFAPATFIMDSGNISGNALASYVVEGKYTSNDLSNGTTFTALDGTPITVTLGDGGFYVNGALVIDVNIAATNGVIHMINGSFTPPA